MMNWIDLDLFCGKGKFCSLGFGMGKPEKKMHFSDAVVPSDMKMHSNLTL